MASTIDYPLRPDGWTIENPGVGIIHWEMDLGQWLTIDALKIIKHGNVSIQWRGSDDWYDLNKVTFDQRGLTEFRAIMDGGDGQPIFIGMFLRFNAVENTIVKSEVKSTLKKWGK